MVLFSKLTGQCFGQTTRTIVLFLTIICLTTGMVQAKTLMFGHTVPPTHVWHKVAVRFAENLAAASKDKMTVRVVPLQKLGNEPQLFSMAQSGAITFSMLPVGFLSNREESLLGWFLPYLFDDVEQAGNASKLPAALQMLKNLEPHGVVGLGYAFAGMQHVLSVAPVDSPDDLINKKIRTFPSPIFNDWWHVLGAAPTALPLAEIAPSLTTNLLDAAAVDLDIIVGLKYHQQAKYLAFTNHMAFPCVVFASKKWWDGLNSEEQMMVNQAFHEAEQYGISIQIKAEVTNLEKLAQDGAVVNRPDLKPFKAKAGQIVEKYTAQNDLIRQFASEVEANRN